MPKAYIVEWPILPATLEKVEHAWIKGGRLFTDLLQAAGTPLEGNPAEVLAELTEESLNTRASYEAEISRLTKQAEEFKLVCEKQAEVITEMTKEASLVHTKLLEQVSSLKKLVTGKESGGALTPNAQSMAGSGIPIVGYTSQQDIARVRKGKSGDIYGSKNWEGSDEEVANIPLVRQSDAQAQIVALEAEAVRLREENERLHRIAHSGKGSVTQVIHSPTRFMEPALKGGAA